MAAATNVAQYAVWTLDVTERIFGIGRDAAERIDMAHPYDIERASDLHVEWCRDLAERMDVRTTHQSGPQMRAVMHELRRALTPEYVLKVANQLPALERGIFLDGWRLDEGPVEITSADEFAEKVYNRVKAHHFHVPSLVGDVFWLWNDKLEPEKAGRILRCLPEPLADLWREVCRTSREGAGSQSEV